MVLSALIFIRKTCEVVSIELDLGNLKTKILGENVKKAESTQFARLCFAPSSPLASSFLRELALASKSLAVAS